MLMNVSIISLSSYADEEGAPVSAKFALCLPSWRCRERLIPMFVSPVMT